MRLLFRPAIPKGFARNSARADGSALVQFILDAIVHGESGFVPISILPKKWNFPAIMVMTLR